MIIIAAAIAMMVSWTACTQVEETGKVQFGLELEDDSELKSAVADRDVAEALVSILSVDGEVIFDKEPIPVYNFGDGFITKSLKLRVGEFMLTEFMLLDSNGMVVWATPKAGSNLAHLVRQPLPVYFQISHEQTTSLDIQVIRVGNYNPDDFGYVNFNIGFVDRFCLKVFYSSRCMEEWPDDVLGPDGTVAPIHQPMLTVYIGDRKVMHEPMNPGLNRYELPLVNTGYLLTASDCRGRVFYEEKFYLKELLAHSCHPDIPPLVIYHDSDPGVIITPEGLYEPTINQGVFGSIVLPVDNNMEDGQPDIWPVVRDIYFFPYAVMDSIYTFAAVDCYFPYDMIGMKPTAIVRTNSEGYFQVPLDVGEYLYLVKEEGGYYIDAHISSHRPGYVMVYPGEVTELWINVIDCSMWQ